MNKPSFYFLIVFSLLANSPLQASLLANSPLRASLVEAELLKNYFSNIKYPNTKNLNTEKNSRNYFLKNKDLKDLVEAAILGIKAANNSLLKQNSAFTPTPPIETPPIETPPIETPPIETPPIETPPIERVAVRRLLKNSSIRPINSPSTRPINDFSFTEYEHYMELIKEIDEEEYNRLRRFEKELEEYGESPIEQTIGNDKSTILPATEKTLGYPRLIIPSLLTFDRKTQKDYLSSSLATYKTYPAGTISLEDRKIILEILKSFAPELYDEFIAVDPTGVDHIIPYDHPYAAITASLEDGLPIIYIGNKEMQLPRNQLRWCMAHELGHYALGHFGHHTATHAILDGRTNTPPNHNTPLTFKGAFEKAWQRTQEYEADRFSIMNLGANIDDAIEYMGEHQPHTSKKYEAFQAIHPLPHQFIDHMKSLRREVEWQKDSKLPLPKTDWKALIKKYKQSDYPTFYEALQAP